MCYKKPEEAWRSFDRHAPQEIPRIMLCDTWCDEKSESLRAAECGAAMVRLDTPRSRRGDMLAIIDEVRWELDAHGYERVKILLTGGVTRDDIIASRRCVDAFGVGGAIANAPVIDFGMDIVEIEGEPKAKRGKRSGVKQVYEIDGGNHEMLPLSRKAPEGGKPLLEPFINNGVIVKRSGMQEARQRVLEKIPTIPAA
jgi:nicotinate phosphoribosyltransferase